MHKLLPLLAAGLLLAAPASAADQLAFPGAAGWGRYAKGARASSSRTVYHVTNLNDSGTGSLRDAVSQSNRIVVFDVSGVINISSRIVFSSNLYVAGQTAPGEGITVYGDGVSFSGASNIICRYLRVRMGHNGTSGKDCAGVANGTNMIFDHCSFSWGLDETFSINPDNKGDLGNITLQNCIFGQGLLTHSAGGLMQADSITLYRNLYIDNSTRNNKVKGINQYANNVVYNWKNGAYIMGGDSEGESYVNIESNLFINGPAKGGAAFTGANSDFHVYGDDNWQDSNIDGVYDPSLITDYSASTRVSTPYDYPDLELYAGNELLEKNIPTVGASLPYRDQSDCYMIDELMSYGTSGALITYETSLAIGAPSTWDWYTGEKPTDTDGDGMPDAWETANGTDPNTDDATTLASNGYLNIENYINSITEDDRNFFLRKPITAELSASTTTSLTLGWRDYTYAEEGFVVEFQQEDGTWKEMARTEAGATEVTITGLSEATQYAVRIAAFATHDGSEVLSDYATLTATTRQVESGIVDIDTYVPDLTLGTSQSTWDYTTTDWQEGRAFTTGDKVLLANDGDARTVTISESVEPATVVVTGDGDITLSGIIEGDTTTVNHQGKGTLTLSGSSTYKGATVNHSGTIEFESIANGGEASAIGAALAFPQNWVMYGGTYRYTGGDATTDRGAQLKADSKLEIANAVTVTESGSFEGDGGLELDGNGTLSVADAETFFAYSGNTTLTGGTLQLSDVENASKIFAKSGKTVVLNGGTIDFAYVKDDSQSWSYNIIANDGTTSTVMCPTTGTFSGSLTGNGDVELVLPYQRFNIGTTLSGFTGRIIANGQPIQTAQSPLFYHSSQWNSPNLRVHLTGTVYMTAWTTNATNYIGGISGDAGTYLIGSSKQTSGHKCLWNVGYANSDETFRGIINDLPAGLKSAYSGTTSINKVGTGDWRLTGANTYSGTTTVTGGQLIINGSHTGTGAITVLSDATLKGEGTISGAVTAQSGATIEAGDTVVYGKTLRLKGAVTMQGGSTLRIPLTVTSAEACKQNAVAFSSSLTIADTTAVLELDMTNVATPAAGQSWTIFSSVPTSTSGTFTISPAVPGDGLEWDTSDLYTSGKIYIVAEGDAADKEEDDDDAVYERTVLYSWTSPDGTPIETGGTASMQNAPSDAADRVNYVNAGYYTISLNGKYGNMNDATASNNSTYIQIDLDESLETGDSIFITAYRNKGTGAESSIYFDYGSATYADETSYGDIASGDEPSDGAYRIPDGASGSDVIKLSRNTASTNLFITSFAVTRWQKATGIAVIEADEDATSSVLYNISGQRVDDSYRGIVVSQNKKYLRK